MELIEWCNSNQGFATIILSTLALIVSIVTVIVSIVAIFVSINTAKLPYKKKININTVYDEREEGKYSCELYIINTGNRTIGITNISLEYDGDLLYNFNTVNTYIEPSKVHKHCFDFEKNNIGYKRAKIEILDTEQDEHIFEEEIAMG